MKTTTKAKAQYRMPRESKQIMSRVLSLDWDGAKAVMTGGIYGSHVLHTSDLAAVKAHWSGYVSNNMGRTIKPSIVAFDIREEN